MLEKVQALHSETFSVLTLFVSKLVMTATYLNKISWSQKVSLKNFFVILYFIHGQKSTYTIYIEIGKFNISLDLTLKNCLRVAS